MIGQHNGSGSRPKVFRLGLKVWRQRKTHVTECDEWRGEVYDQLEPRLSEPFRGLKGLLRAVLRTVSRIQGGERSRYDTAASTAIEPPEAGSKSKDTED